MEKKWKLVYICSKYAGDVEANSEAAIKYSRFAIEKGYMPLAAHLLYPRILNDDDKNERSLGLFFGNTLLGMCEEMWVFSDGDFSAGMKNEMEYAEKRKIPIRYYNVRMEAIT